LQFVGLAKSRSYVLLKEIKVEHDDGCNI